MSTAHLSEAMVTGIGNRLYVQRLITPSLSQGGGFIYFLWLVGQTVTERSLPCTCKTPRGEAGVLSLDNLDNSVHHVRHTMLMRKWPIKSGDGIKVGEGETASPSSSVKLSNGNALCGVNTFSALM